MKIQYPRRSYGCIPQHSRFDGPERVDLNTRFCGWSRDDRNSQRNCRICRGFAPGARRLLGQVTRTHLVRVPSCGKKGTCSHLPSSIPRTLADGNQLTWWKPCLESDMKAAVSERQQHGRRWVWPGKYREDRIGGTKVLGQWADLTGEERGRPQESYVP